MKWNLCRAFITVFILIHCTASFAKNTHVISGLDAARDYHGKANSHLYIRVGTFSFASNAKHYQSFIQSKTRYRVAMVHQKGYYIVTIGPIQSASEARQTAKTILHSQQQPTQHKIAKKQKTTHPVVKHPRKIQSFADAHTLEQMKQRTKAIQAIKEIQANQLASNSPTTKTTMHPDKEHPQSNNQPMSVTPAALAAPDVVPAGHDASEMPVPSEAAVVPPGEVVPATNLIPMTNVHPVTKVKPVKKMTPVTKVKPVNTVKPVDELERPPVSYLAPYTAPASQSNALNDFSESNWFATVGVGERFPFFKDSMTINNGSGAPAPYDQDIYNTSRHHQPMILLAAGRRWVRENPWFPAISASLAYQYLFATNTGGTIIQYSDPEFTNYTYNWDISSNLLQALFKFNIYQYEKFSPFVALGLGGGFNRTDNYTETALTGVNARVSPGFQANSGLQFAYSLRAGIDYQITPEVFVSAEYQYLDLGKLSSGRGVGDWSDQSLNLGAYRSNAVVLNVGYLIGK